MWSILLAAVVELNGVIGSDLRARAFFDANNVRVGDPLVLTVDFLGDADFKSLHPPALSKCVDRKDWKLDDVSAKTDTFRDARRLTYRVRPMRAGVIWFPSLTFKYAAADGTAKTVTANAIPVHAKEGAQVVVTEMAETAENGMPQPPPLVTALAAGQVNEDTLFSWRKACASPSAAAFAEFDFPEARLNEARCAILEGNWAQALKIYSRVEWLIGQTPEIERGIVAAMALRYDNPSVELPVWRQVGRPILRYDWKGRAGIVFGALAAFVVLFWLIGRGIRAVACLTAALLLALPTGAQGIFEQMEQMHRRMQQQMQQMSFGFGGSMFEREEREPIRITASLAVDSKQIQVGSPFSFIVSLEAPKSSSIGQIRMTPSEMFGMTVTGEAENLVDAPSKNPTNVIHRLSVPVRYDVPFKGPVAFRIDGMVSGRQTRNGGRFSFTFSNSFQTDTEPIMLEVKPLPTANQPKDFAGIISDGLRLEERLDIRRVETNDIIRVTYLMYPRGYVPAEFIPEGMSFEWTRSTDRSGRVNAIEYRGFFVATGAASTPKARVTYYNPKTKKYESAEVGGTPISYVATAEGTTSEVEGDKGGERRGVIAR